MAVLRLTAILGYIVGMVAAAIFSYAYFKANAHLPSRLGLNEVAWTAVPILLLLAVAIPAQAVSTRIGLLLLACVIGAGVTLAISMFLHAFPDRAFLASVAHLGLVAAGVIAALFLVVGRT